VSVEPGNRKLLRLEVRNAQTPIERKPPWIKTTARMGPEYTSLKGLVRREGLHTVCEEAGCPNIFECWEDREATFLIGGEQCTRRCDFCQIDTGKPAELDRDEPRRVAESVAAMGLRYSTITGVARDDLPDGGAWLYAETPIERKPPWIKTRARMGPEYTALKSLVRREGLHTVCEEAGCPNIFECWEDREATFLIGGEQCTRRCDFCQIDTGKPAELDRDEPRRVAESVAAMGLKYATVTGVARDDLPDGGAWLYAETVRAIKRLNPTTGVELLAPDFNGEAHLLREVFDSRPEVFAHNLETVPRIFKRIRPAFRYQRSLDVITAARDFGLVTKSNLILGMGETIEEVQTALADLHDAGCDIVTITQYLRPSPRHHPVERWVAPEEFVALAGYAEKLGFAGVLAGPLVRSSYRAGRLYAEAAAGKRSGV